jgi:hypothetical protein
MSTQAETSRGEYRFIVKEYGDGTPWIMLELYREPGLPILEDGFLGFDLPPGTDIRRAREIADFLEENLTTLSHTRFI